MILASVFALLLLATLIVGLSSWGVLFPGNLISFVRAFMRRSGSIIVAVTVRLLLAALLWVTASASSTPAIFNVLAGLALLSAFGIAVVGPERVSRFIERVASWPEFVVRLQCLLGIAFGVFLIWSVSPVWVAT